MVERLDHSFVTRHFVDRRAGYAWSPANIKGKTKMPKFVLESPRPCRNCFFCARTSLARVSFRVFARVSLCMNYVTNMFLLVGWLLCFVQGQGLKREQKHATKNFDEFHNHSPRHKYKCFVNCSFRLRIRWRVTGYHWPLYGCIFGFNSAVGLKFCLFHWSKGSLKILSAVTPAREFSLRFLEKCLVKPKIYHYARYQGIIKHGIKISWG